MSVMYAWPKTATEIVNEIDDENELCWDTDSNISILTGFIEEHCNPAEFEAFVRRIAMEDKQQQAASWK